MPLTSDEAATTYHALVQFLKDSELQWIVAQVEEQVALGHVESKRMAVSERDPFDEEDTRSRKRRAVSEPDLFGEAYPNSREGRRQTRKTPATFVVSREYSPEERLLLLIDSAVIGIVQLNQIADEVAQFFEKELGNGTVRFEPEADVKPSFEIGSRATARSRIAAEALLTLLAELKREIPSADQSAITD